MSDFFLCLMTIGKDHDCEWDHAVVMFSISTIGRPVSRLFLLRAQAEVVLTKFLD